MLKIIKWTLMMNNKELKLYLAHNKSNFFSTRIIKNYHKLFINNYL